MELILTTICVVLFLTVVYLYMVFPARLTKEEKAKFEFRSYAHRALFDNATQRPENSLAAFEAAMQHGYGCELDVQFTKDKQIIVFHDNDFMRTSGVDKKVWELTYDEVKQIKLFNSNETAPLFSDVLKLVDGKQPLIIEFKAEKLNNQWYYELCGAAMELLCEYKGAYCVESFHPLVVRWFLKNHPNIVRGQLVNSRKNNPDIKPWLAYPVEKLLTSFLTRPHFIAYKEKDRNRALRVVQKLGAITVMWTVKTQERQSELEKYEDAIIFEGYSPHETYKK